MFSKNIHFSELPHSLKVKIALYCGTQNGIVALYNGKQDCTIDIDQYTIDRFIKFYDNDNIEVTWIDFLINLLLQCEIDFSDEEKNFIFSYSLCEK